jgi:hypothetical protein
MARTDPLEREPTARHSSFDALALVPVVTRSMAQMLSSENGLAGHPQ